MVVTIKKNNTKKEIEAALQQLGMKRKKPKVADFYGKLKGKFEDGLAFQKSVRNEWD